MQIGSQYCFFDFDFCNLTNDLFNLDVLMFVWNLLVNIGFLFLILFLIVQAVMIEVIDEEKIIKLIHDRYKDKILRSFIFIIFELTQFGSIKQDSILNYY